MSSVAPPTGYLPRSRSFGPRATLIAVGNEIHKGLLHAWGERLQILIELPLFLIFFLLVALVVGRGQQIIGGHLDWRFQPAEVSPLMVGYAVFLFIYLQTAKLFWRLLGEIQAGTLEQVYLSPLPAWLVATAGRVLATVLETAVLVAILYLVVYAIVPFHLVWRPQALVPIALIAVGSVGYSLIEGGMILAWKRVEMVHEMALGLMVFFSGALIPLERLPAWMAEIGRFSPISQGIVALRAILVDGRESFPAGGDGSLLWMAGVGGAYLLIGIAAFSLGESRARRQGSLGRY
jgi:ABC-2 type transport system permease protein